MEVETKAKEDREFKASCDCRVRHGDNRLELLKLGTVQVSLCVKVQAMYLLFFFFSRQGFSV